MPLMGGRELARELSALHPKTSILFMSGYTDDAVVRHGIMDKDIEYLQKPFTPESLVRRVSEVLRDARTRTSRSG
jgi:DNA-binding response OmpR family regulator